MKCFLSCSFKEEDRNLRLWFTNFLQAFPDMKVVVAKDDISPPAEQVEECLGECQLACFIITEREGSPPAWILQEIEMARARGLTLFAFVEEQISENKLGTLPSHVSFQRFDRVYLKDKIPDYIRYSYNARLAALKKQQIDRKTLVGKVKLFQKRIEEMGREIELLEVMAEPRLFDD